MPDWGQFIISLKWPVSIRKQHDFYKKRKEIVLVLFAFPSAFYDCDSFVIRELSVSD